MRWAHGWGLAGQILTLWIIVSILASPFIGRYLRARRILNSTSRRISSGEAHARTERLAQRLRTADWVNSLPEHEKQRLQREAEALGFCDEGDAA